MKLHQLALAAAASLGFAGSGHAAGVVFNPDGVAGGAPTVTVGSFDWAPTSFLALGGNQAVTNFLSGACVTNAAACTFDVLTHAKLIGTLSPTNAINAMPGLGTSYEITMIARFTETVVNAFVVPDQAANATFLSVANTGFVEWFYQPIVDSNDLEGANFNNGRLILSGQVSTASLGNFTVDLSKAPVALDGNGTNDFTGQQTVTGTGSQGNLGVGNLVVDTAFFETAFGLTLNFANISQGLPYISVDPSDCYTGTASGAAVGGTSAGGGCAVGDHVNGLFSAQNVPAAPGIRPTIGSINGFGDPRIGGPDFVAQTDFNSPVTAQVPEPASLALVGLALAGLGFARRRRAA